MAEALEYIVNKHTDLKRFRDFKRAIISRNVRDIARRATALNLELSLRHVLRTIQQRHGLVKVGYLDLPSMFVGKLRRQSARMTRSYGLRARGAAVGNGVKIDGRITIVGNPKNVVLSDHVRVLGDMRVITGHGLPELIHIGPHTTIDHGATLFSHGGPLVIGSNCYVGPRVHVQAKGGISIGDDTMIAANASIFASNHITEHLRLPFRSQGERFKGITIGRNCWIGAGCIVLDGTVLGDNCVVGAGCIVRGHFAPGSKIVNRDALGLETVS
jgi:acetyltransferase-like isoleucine patch superfamily enzyme